MRAVAAAFALAFAASAASAATIDPFKTIQSVNGVIFGSATTSADVEGQLIVGGSYSGASMYNHPPATPLAGYGALTVYGATSGNPININNGGNAYVGGAKGETINFNGGGHYLSSVPNTSTDFQTALTGYSISLSNLATNNGNALPATGNNEVIVVHPNASGVAIFNITASALEAIPSYSFNLNGATSVLFNVSDTAASTDTLTFNANFQGNGDLTGKSIVWNFYQAKSITFGTQWTGTVLAPLANVVNQNQIDGALVAKSWTGHGELHDDLYSGRNFLATPEPGTWAMLVMGVGAIGGMLRGQRKRAAAQTSSKTTAA